MLEENDDTLKFDDETQKLIEDLEKDPKFQDALEGFVADMSKDNYDLSALQSKIMLLVKPILEKTYKGQDLGKKLEEVKNNQKTLEGRVKDLSLFFTMKKSADAKTTNLPKDKNAHLNKTSLDGIKAELKKGTIYALYKMANPRKIAGETARENYLGNVATKGTKEAAKYSTPEEAKEYKKDIEKIRPISPPKLPAR